jgi:hypothetical protein
MITIGSQRTVITPLSLCLSLGVHPIQDRPFSLLVAAVNHPEWYAANATRSFNLVKRDLL